MNDVRSVLANTLVVYLETAKIFMQFVAKVREFEPEPEMCKERQYYL